MINWQDKLKAVDTRQSTFEHCFACGQENPAGLRLQFVQKDGEATSEFVITEKYQGWSGIAHGGIVFTILDEAVAYSHFPQIKSVTVKAEVRFRQPAPIGVPMVVRARIIRRTRRLLTTVAQITLRDGTMVAESTAESYILEIRNNG